MLRKKHIFASPSLWAVIRDGYVGCYLYINLKCLKKLQTGGFHQYKMPQDH